MFAFQPYGAAPGYTAVSAARFAIPAGVGAVASGAPAG